MREQAEAASGPTQAAESESNNRCAQYGMFVLSRDDGNPIQVALPLRCSAQRLAERDIHDAGILRFSVEAPGIEPDLGQIVSTKGHRSGTTGTDDDPAKGDAKLTLPPLCSDRPSCDQRQSRAQRRALPRRATPGQTPLDTAEAAARSAPTLYLQRSRWRPPLTFWFAIFDTPLELRATTCCTRAHRPERALQLRRNDDRFGRCLAGAAGCSEWPTQVLQEQLAARDRR